MTKLPPIPQQERKAVGALATLRLLYRFLEEGAQRFASERGAPICVEGCGLCCMLNTPAVTSVEAEYVTAVGFPRLSQETRARIRERIRAWHHPSQVAFPFRGTQDLRTLTPAQSEAHLRDRVAATHATCPFFESTTKQCLIWEWRPLPCRFYSFTRAPDSFCQRPLVGSETREQRRWLSRVHPVGLEVREAVRGWWNLVRQERVSETVGWLPNLVARYEYPRDLRHWLAEAPVPAARMMIGYGNLPYPIDEEEAAQDRARVVAAGIEVRLEMSETEETGTVRAVTPS